MASRKLSGREKADWQERRLEARHDWKWSPYPFEVDWLTVDPAQIPERESEKLLQIFGEELRRLRKSCWVSRPRLAQATGLSIEYIRKLEQGRRSPSLLTLIKIGIVLERESSNPQTPGLSGLMEKLEGIVFAGESATFAGQLRRDREFDERQAACTPLTQ